MPITTIVALIQIAAAHLQASDLVTPGKACPKAATAGDTWRSRLAPGYPGDPDAENIPAEFAADPRLAAIPGMAIFNFIAGYRDSNVGVLAIQHWLEVNKEDAGHYEPGYTTWFADTGTEGRFLDKPDMLAVLDKSPGTIELATVMENPELGVDGVITRSFPTGTLYVAYAVFTGSFNSIKVLVKTSDDWGRTWKNQALKLSEDQNQVSGITLTAIGDKVLAVWRRKGDGNDPDSILYSVITNGGKKATKGEVLADICAFDQPTLTGTEIDPDFNVVTFRTNDFPWTANDGENFYVFYSDRERVSPGGACLTDAQGNPNGKPRIVMHHSTLSGNADWTNYGPIDTSASLTANTFQFMPTAFGANGKVQVAWYDTRRDPSDPLALPFVADYDALVEGRDPTFINGFLVNRTVDVFTTSIAMTGSGPDVKAPVRASQFSILVAEEGGVRKEYETEASFANKKLFAQGSASFLGDYIAMAAREYRRNAADTAWESNASAIASDPNRTEDFFVAWTDNRDVRGAITSLLESSSYSYGRADSALQADVSDKETDAEQLVDFGPPRDSSMIAEGLDGTDNAIGTCDAQTERTRDANIYGSLIKDRERLYAPNPTKPLGGLERAFPVVLRNSDDVAKSYRLEIDCVGCLASFRQRSLTTPEYNEPPVGSPEPFIVVPPKSQIARTVFVTGDQDPVKVNAYDESNTLLATIKLANSPDQFRDPENCDPTTTDCSVASNELHNLELQTIDVHFLDLLTVGENDLDALAALNCTRDDAPDDCDPTIAASALINWAVENGCCDGENPPSLGSVIEFAVENLADETINIQDPANTTGDAALLNAALLNAALLNANLLNADLLNANLLNAALLNANLLNGSPTDLSVLDPALTTQEVLKACCFIEVDEQQNPAPTVGSIIVWAYNNPDIINASLLNAALLNANLLNANLLNANLLNANLLNASLLNANLLNASLLNAALLNPTVEAAALLNANLLNADLLNASLLNPTLVEQAVDGGCCGDLTSEEAAAAAAVDVIIYAVGHPEIINASLLNASLLNANLLNANLLNANLLNANLLNANLLNANLLNANLLNADLLNANLLNANLLNANLLNADLLNANLLNASLLNSSLTTVNTGDQTVTVKVGDDQGIPQPYTGDVTFDDYTYPITNNGNVTTAIDADITINAPTVTVDGEEVLDVIGTKLIIWTTNATPTVVDCEERVQLNTRVQSITSPDSSFDVATINQPFKGQASAVVAAGETAFVTLRVVGTKEQLKNVRVSGFTASSQAANCRVADVSPENPGGCDDVLNDGIEQITFADQDPPVITVPVNDIIVEAAIAGGAVVTYSDRVTVFDASDANPSLECLPESGSVFPIGLTRVTCNATDASGNQADTAGFNVVVQDTTDPTIAAPANVTLEANGNPSTFTDADFGTATGSDISGIVITYETPVGGFIIGPNNVIWTATDGNGRTAQATQVVSVQDTTDPTITAPANVTLEANGNPSTFTDADFGTATGSDIFGVDFTYEAPVGGFIIGPNNVIWTASDGNGRTAQATQVVTVQDTTDPTITAPANVTLEANGNPSTFTDADFGTATGSDIFGVDFTYEAPVGGFIIGPNNVIWTATDGNGRTAQATQVVTVQDTTVPVIAAPANVTLEANGNPSTFTDADFGTATGSDIFGVDFTYEAPVGGFIIGPNNVIWTASDGNGRTAQATQVVTVQDTTDPTITAPAAISLEANGNPSTFTDADFGTATGSDIFGVDFTYEAPVGGFIIGPNNVIWTATDGSGRTAQATQVVTVQDTTDPTIAAPANVTLEANGNPSTFTNADFGTATGSDIFGVDFTYEAPVGGFIIGPNDVIWTATDGNGRTAQATQVVTVQDTTVPTITAPANATLNASGELTSNYSCSDFGAPTVFDLFGTPSVECSPTTGLVLGDNTITWTVTDGNLNTNSITQTVTLVDALDPIIDDVVPNIGFEPQGTYPYVLSADLNTELNTVQVSWPISVTDSDSNLTISCSIDGQQATPLTTNPTTGEDGYPKVEDGKVVAWFNYEFGPGDTTVSCTATDSQGQEGTFVFTVSVFDTTPPVISVPSEPVTIRLPDENGSFEYDYSSLVSVTDNADANPTLECRTNPDDLYSSNFIDPFSYGETTVECRAQDNGPADGDGSFNESLEQFTIIARYPYDVVLTPPKGRARAGSTVPLDWLYLDGGVAIDSSAFMVGVTWERTDGWHRLFAMIVRICQTNPPLLTAQTSSASLKMMPTAARVTSDIQLRKTSGNSAGRHQM